MSSIYSKEKVFVLQAWKWKVFWPVQVWEPCLPDQEKDEGSGRRRRISRTTCRLWRFTRHSARSHPITVPYQRFSICHEVPGTPVLPTYHQPARPHNCSLAWTNCRSGCKRGGCASNWVQRNAASSASATRRPTSKTSTPSAPTSFGKSPATHI